MPVNNSTAVLLQYFGDKKTAQKFAAAMRKGLNQENKKQN